MIKYKTVTEEVEKEIIEDVLCNKCGESTDNAGETGSGHDFKEFEGARVSTSFGYFSKHFGDMVVVEFDLCEKCLYDLVQTFKIPAIDDNWWESQAEVVGFFEDSVEK